MPLIFRKMIGEGSLRSVGEQENASLFEAIIYPLVAGKRQKTETGMGLHAINCRWRAFFLC